MSKKENLTQLPDIRIKQQMDSLSEPLIQNNQLQTHDRSTPFINNTEHSKQQENSQLLTQVQSSDEDDTKYLKLKQQYEVHQREIYKMRNRKMTIGSGFSLDMGDFFQFKTQKQKKNDPFSSLVYGGHLTWIILLYSVCNAAIMPAWIMSIQANKILRISWRFLLQAMCMIPFVLYERRTGNEQVKRKYSLEYILSPEGLKKIFICSIGTSIWFSIILSCFQWTYISHSLVLGSLSNFFLSLNRSINNETHSLEPGGQIFVIVGIIFVVSDSYMLNVLQCPNWVWDVINPYYLSRKPVQRVLADLAALSAAFITAKFSQINTELKSYYPPFLSMFLVNISISFNVMFSAFYINGATFDRDSSFGVFGLFTDKNFGTFFYMAVILSFGTYLSLTLISKLFADPIIPALAMTLQPYFATFFLNLVAVQTMPGSFTIYGYIFVICGLFLILIGQFLLQKKKQNNQEQKKIQQSINKNLLDQSIVELEQIGEQTGQIFNSKQLKVQKFPNKQTEVYKITVLDVAH